jgi:hypothetical protein
VDGGKVRKTGAKPLFSDCRSFVSLGVARGRSPLHGHKGKGKSRDDAASLPAASKSLIVYRSGKVRHLVTNRDSSVAIAKSLTVVPRKPIVCSAQRFFGSCGSATRAEGATTAGRKPLPEERPHFRFAPLGAKRGFGKPAQICSVRWRDSASAKKGGRSRTRSNREQRPFGRLTAQLNGAVVWLGLRFVGSRR